MGERLFALLRGHFTTHGYWTLAITLLLENAGIPVPGETALLFASFLAYEHKELDLALIILVATAASAVGDNCGYWIGFYGGRPLLHRYQKVFRIPDRVIQRGEYLFQSYGSVTVFLARFVFGMRVVCGPLAGVLRMPWRKFVLFNILGAAAWSSAISTIGYVFGQNWEQLLRFVQHLNTGIVIVIVLVVLYLWWRYHKKMA